MIFLNSNRMKLVVIGVVAVIVLGLGSAKADFIFGELTNLGSPVNSPSADVFGCMSADGLEIYIERADGSTDWRYYIWVAKRPTIDDEWGTPVRLGSNVNAPGLDNQEASISADGLELYFSRGGKSTDYDLYVTTRETTAQEWLPAVSLGDVVNSSALEDGASISADGLSLYFVSNRDGGEGGKDLYVTRRESTNHAWDIPVNLGPNINSPEQDSAPSISSDNLTLIFRSNRPGKYSSKDYPDIWLTTRRTTSDSWREPINLGPEINSDDVDLATISPDAQTLYLTCYVRSGGIGWYDIWKAPVIPVVDLNSDAFIDALDMCIMVDHWGDNYPLCDIGPTPLGDGIVDIQDLIVLAEHLFTYPGAVAYWTLDETEGEIAYDSAAINDAIVFGGAVWQPTGGKVDGALELDGIDDYVSTPYILSPTDGDFSVFAWIKGGVAGQVILSQEGGANWLMTDSIEGALKTDLKQPAIPNRNPIPPGPPLTSSIVVTDGDWHRVGFVRNGSERILYVDDIEIARDTATYLKAADGGLHVGAGSGLERGTFWSGLIDDVRIYNRAVSP